MQTNQSHGVWSQMNNYVERALCIVPGATGFPGAPGPAGQPGFVGSTGRAGLPGPKGDTGPIGVQGLGGNTGLPGGTGLTGATGIMGRTGDTGIYGATGATGRIHAISDSQLWMKRLHHNNPILINSYVLICFSGSWLLWPHCWNYTNEVHWMKIP